MGEIAIAEKFDLKKQNIGFPNCQHHSAGDSKMEKTTSSLKDPRYKPKARNNKKALPGEEDNLSESDNSSEVKPTKKPILIDQRIKENCGSQYRSNLRAFMMLVKEIKFRSEHLDVLRKTPFWLLFNAFITNTTATTRIRKFADGIATIIRSYSANTKGFKLGPKIVSLRDSDICLIFGINSGSTKLNLSYAKKPNTPFIERRFKETNRLSKPLLEEALKKTVNGKKQHDVEDVARIMCLYICATLLFATSGHTIGWVFVKYIEDLENMKSYAWSSAIRSSLISSIETAYSSPEKATGCVIALLYWICEHTTLVQPEDENVFPRFLKWDLTKLNKKMRGRSLKILKSKEVLGAELVPSKKEQKLLSGEAEQKRISGKEQLEKIERGVCSEISLFSEDSEKNGAELDDHLGSLGTLCDVAVQNLTENKVPLENEDLVKQNEALYMIKQLAEENVELKDQNKSMVATIVMLKNQLNKLEQDRATRTKELLCTVKENEQKMLEMRTTMDVLLSEMNQLQTERDLLDEQVKEPTMQKIIQKNEDQEHCNETVGEPLKDIAVYEGLWQETARLRVKPLQTSEEKKDKKTEGGKKRKVEIAQQDVSNMNQLVMNDVENMPELKKRKTEIIDVPIQICSGELFG